MKVNQISAEEKSKISLATTILTLGMMGSLAAGIFLGGSAFASASLSIDIPPEEDETVSSDSSSVKPYHYGSSTSNNATHSGGADATTYIDQTNESVTVTNETQVIGAEPVEAPKEAPQHNYPTFSKEEINALFSVDETTPAEPGAPVESTEPTESGDLEYLEETAQVYRHVPVNPVYTYGKDTEGKGVCAGTEEFCAKSEELWKNFEEKIENDESITHTEGEKKGQLIMPDPYVESIKNMPSVKPGECPEGYEAYPSGNPTMGVTKPHCGKLEGSTYYVAPIQ